MQWNYISLILILQNQYVYYPTPDISGKYEPQPKTGGKDKANEYTQHDIKIFVDDLKDAIFPS